MNNKNKKEDSLLKKMWATPRGKAAIKLGLYLIFIVFVVIFINVSSKVNKIVKESTVNEEKEITIGSMREKLLLNNYKYTYTITKNDKKTVYSGERLKQVETGTKENEFGTIKYYVNDVETYQIQMGEKKQIDNLYEDFNINLLDSEYLLNLTNDKSTIINKDKDLKEYNYSFDLEDKEIDISIYTKNDNIKEIKVIYDDTTYELKYSNIGEIKEIEIE